MRVALFSLLTGCATTVADSAESCADAPVLTYDNFGHADAPDPRLVEGGVLLTVVGDIARERFREWRAGRTVRLPAQLHRPSRYLDPGVPDEEREKLSLWLSCGQ